MGPDNLDDFDAWLEGRPSPSEPTPDLTVGEAQRSHREKLEDEMRAASAVAPFDDGFMASDKIDIWIGIDDHGNQQIRFKWGENLPNTTVIGVCEYLSYLLKRTMHEGTFGHE